MSTINRKKRYQVQEPTPKNSLDLKEYESELYACYANYKGISESKDHKKWILDYVSKILEKDSSQYSKGKLKEYTPWGIWARLLTRGFSIPDKEKTNLDSFLNTLVEKNKLYLQSRQTAIVERNKMKDLAISETLTGINICIDSTLEYIRSNKKGKYDVLSNCSRITIPSGGYNPVLEHIQNVLSGAYKARNKEDEQFVEAYSFLSKNQLKSYIQYLENMLDFYTSKNCIKQRKPRKKKDKTPEQLVKGVKYQVEEESLKLKSLNPISIIGSTAVAIFNTKVKAITIYYAKDQETLSFKGTTLLNIDESKCTSKKIRNYEKFIKTNSLTCTTFNHAIKLFSSLTTKESKPKARINSNTIILAVKK